MAKVQKIKTEVKSAIQRKSAYSLPNNPTDSGYKADDIRKAFYKPIIDITNSALTEIDRVVDELNGVLGYSQKQMDSVESVSGIYFHGADGIIYTFSDNEFTVSGYEGDKTDLTIPQTVLYQGAYYPVVAIGSSAFGGALKSVEIPSSVTIVYSNAFKNCSSLASVKFLGKTYVSDSNAFTSGKINFSVPKEYLTVYQTSLASYKKSLTGFDTIINNANDIVILYRDKLTKRVIELLEKNGVIYNKKILESKYDNAIPGIEEDIDLVDLLADICEEKNPIKLLTNIIKKSE